MTARQYIGIALGAAAAMALSVIYFVNPEGARWMPKCIVYTATGLKCPSCGNTRALYHLMHGHIAQAIAYNPFMLVAGPLALLIIYLCIAKPAWAPDKLLIWLVWAYLAIYALWFVTRNIFGL